MKICGARQWQWIGLLVSLAGLNFIACHSPAPQTTNTSITVETARQQNAIVLIKSIEDGDVDTLKRLIAEGSPLNVKNEQGEPLLMIAINRKRKPIRKDIIESLLKAGVGVNASDDDGKLVLFTAIELEQTEIIELLINNGIQVNVKDNDDDSALHRAVDRHNVAMMKILLAANPDLAIRDKIGNTPLFNATYDYNIAKLLIEKGADVNALNGDGGTALFSVIWSQSIKTVQLFLEHGANVNVKDKNGWTPLKTAWLQGCLDIVHLLEKAGAKE